MKRLLDAAASYYAESLRITRNQYQSGTADQSAVSQAEAQLESTQAQAIAVGVTRAQLEHAIAVLIGKPPAEFSILPTEAVIAVPVIPAEMPSALLERRPDIAALERLMASANAQIGIAEAAFYPTITLSANSGTSALTLNRLLATSSRFWAFGSTLVETVFDAGARAAILEEARAFFEETIANYRQSVLAAFQQVEDQLAALRILAQQAEVQDRAVAAAFEAARIINNQYLAGTVAYTSVIVADQTALTNAVTAVNIRPESSRRERRPDPGAWRRLGRRAAAEPRAHRRGRSAQLQPVPAGGGGAKSLSAAASAGKFEVDRGTRRAGEVILLKQRVARAHVTRAMPSPRLGYRCPVLAAAAVRVRSGAARAISFRGRT